MKNKTNKPEPLKDGKVLSIIVISYEEPKEQVLATLKSIDRQKGIDWDKIEVLVINDCGEPLYDTCETDFDGELVNFRVRYIVRQTNGGPLAARQTGYEQSKAPYITYFDTQDEYIYDFAVFLVLQRISRGDLDLIYQARIKEEVRADNGKYIYVYETGTLCNFHGKVFNKYFIRDAGIEWLDAKELAAEDEFFMRQVFDAAEKRHEINDPCYLYRYCRNSLTHTGMQNEFYARIYPDYLRLMDKYLDILNEKFPQRMEDRVSYFILKTFLFLESKYFAMFPVHIERSKAAFKPFYRKYKEFETKSIRKRNDIVNSLSAEIRNYPEISYDDFIKEFKEEELGLA
jgi:glycosyltransferase involved in cell wall biosynthesis